MPAKWSLKDWIDSKNEKSIEYKPNNENVDANEGVPQAQPKMETKTVSIRSEVKDANDWERIRHARDRNFGFVVGQYIQTPPLIFTRDAHSVFIGDMYRGCSAFLILGGPSFANIDQTKLSHAGLLTMGVNNSVKSFRPNLWVSVDSPTHFIKSVWLDPKIQKFVPICHTEKCLWDNEKWEIMKLKVGDCPNVFYYRRNEAFNAQRFLFEDTINWGNHSDICFCGYQRKAAKDGRKESVCSQCGRKEFGGRSVLLPAIRILFYLGVRTVFLLGCDFKMKDGVSNYHFEQKRAPGSVRGNNSSYRILTHRFEELKPVFEQHRFNIFNCNPDSELKVFPFVDFEEAYRYSTAMLPDLKNERTEGLYDREAKEKNT